jgi:hypothetical protein
VGGGKILHQPLTSLWGACTVRHYLPAARTPTQNKPPPIRPALRGSCMKNAIVQYEHKEASIVSTCLHLALTT